MRKNNQLSLSVIISYIQIASLVLIQLLYTPFIIHYLGKSEYGIFQLANSIINYLSLLSLGMASSYIRFYSLSKANKGKSDIDNLNGMYLIVFSILGAIALVLGLILSANISTINNVKLTTPELLLMQKLMCVLAVNMAIYLVSCVFDAFLLANESFLFQRTVNLFKTILSPFICVPLLMLGYNSIAVVIVSTITTIVATLINVYFCILKLKMKFKFTSMKLSCFVEIASFASFIFLNQMTEQINWNVDKLIIGIYKGSEDISLYSVGTSISTLYIMFSTSISSVFIPKVNQIVANDDDNGKLNSIFIRIGKLQYYILMLILTGFAFIGKEFIILWVGKDFASAYWIVICLITPVTVPLVQNIGIEIQKAKNLHKFRSITYLIIAILNVLVSIPLCIKLGALGSAIGTAISLVIGNILIMNYYYQHKVRLDIVGFWKAILNASRGIWIPTIFGFISLKYYDVSSWLNLITWVLMYSIVYGLALYLFSFNSGEKKMFLSKINKKFLVK